MPRDILDELFYGRLAPWEKIPKDDPIISALIHHQSDLRRHMAASMRAAAKP